MGYDFANGTFIIYYYHMSSMYMNMISCESGIQCVCMYSIYLFIVVAITTIQQNRKMLL